MKLIVGPHRVLLAINAGGELIQRAAHRGKLHAITARRRQRGGLGFQTDPQLQHLQHIADGGEVGQGQLERTVGARIKYKGADAMARVDQAAGLQPRDRFSNHGTADAVGAHDFRLGRQLVARTQLTPLDALGQACHQLLREIASARGFVRR